MNPPATSPAPPPPRHRWSPRVKFYLVIYLLVLPTLLGKLLFTYYPNLAVFKYAFYLWDGSLVEEFRGLQNFREVLRDDLFWQTFALIGILLAANLVKMWPSIITAVVLHRLKSERWQYIYRVLFVIPMVIPGLVWLLIWKSFYDPNVGILNVLLQTTGLIHVLQRLDTLMPAVAAALVPVREVVVGAVFGNVWGLLAAAVVLLLPRKTWVLLAIVGLTGVAVMGPVRGLPVLAVAGILAYRRGDAARVAGLIMTGVAVFFILTTMIWTAPTQAFVTGAPAWLGHSQLVIPAVIFWGFPWVGTVGVLIYLADTLRGEAKPLGAALRAQGVERVVMLTGDRAGVARMIAAELEMDEVRAECLPEQKLAAVNELKEQGRQVLVLGDGVNDAPALAAGRVGVAMGALGSDVAIRTADVALMSGNLARLPQFLALSQQTVRVINQNLLWGMAFIGLFILGSSFGFISPIFAAVLHEFSAFFVIFNSARLLRFEPA